MRVLFLPQQEPRFAFNGGTRFRHHAPCFLELDFETSTRWRRVLLARQPACQRTFPTFSSAGDR
jgi:hypothetical protein